METLATSNSIIGNNNGGSSHFSASSSLKDRLLCGVPEFISYRRTWKLASFGLQHFVPLRRGGFDLISCFSSLHQADTRNDAIENQDSNQSKTVRVKFQLQKECTFGEHFFVVGDDPTFGSWDVTSAIPLIWADGHQWAAEMEMPVGKPIQFKFVLLGKTGNVEWQPGPDRTFQPWETTNTIIVSEDWDSADSRIVSEEEKIVNQDEDSLILPEKLMIAENIAYPTEEVIHNTIKDSSFALADTEIAEKSSVESHKELIDGSNISALEENGDNISASEENTSTVSLSEDNASNISALEEDAKDTVVESIRLNKAVSDVYMDSNGETRITSESDEKITEEMNDEKDATSKILGNTAVQESFINYGVPILVPGLPPTPTSSQDEPQHQAILVPGINEFNDHKLPENIQINQKQDPDLVAEQEMETKSSYEIRQEDDTNRIENRSDLQEINDDIVRNDITWGHKTLKKFFSSLRLI